MKETFINSKWHSSSKERNIITCASGICTDAFRLIPDEESSFADYVKGLYEPSSDNEQFSYSCARSIVAKHLLHLVPEHLHETFTNEFKLMQVIQAGPHHRLLADNDFFSSYLLSVLGTSLSGRHLNFMFSCSTVTLEESAKRGPAWLRHKNEVIRVFDLPRKVISKKSIICYEEQVTLSEEMVNWLMTGIPRISDFIDLKSSRTVREHIKILNRHLHSLTPLSQDVQTITFDEDTVSDIIADSINQSSLLRTLLEDGRLTAMSHKVRDSKSEPEGIFIPSSTDLFWLVLDGKIRPLEIRDNRLVSLAYNYSISMEREVLTAEIKSRRIIPNLFLSFLVISILPGIRVLGGAYQCAYHQYFQKIVMSELNISSPLEKSLHRSILNSSLVGWGHNVINYNLWSMASDITVARQKNLDDIVFRKSLMMVSHNFSSFIQDKKWDFFSNGYNQPLTTNSCGSK